MNFFTFKTIFVGNSGTGKSHILNTIEQRLNSTMKKTPPLKDLKETLGVEFYNKSFKNKYYPDSNPNPNQIQDTSIKKIIESTEQYNVHFWELSGQPRYKDIIEPYYTFGDAYVYCCSNRDPYSISDLYDWIKKIRFHNRDRIMKNNNIIELIVYNIDKTYNVSDINQENEDINHQDMNKLIESSFVELRNKNNDKI